MTRCVSGGISTWPRTEESAWQTCSSLVQLASPAKKVLTKKNHRVSFLCKRGSLHTDPLCDREGNQQVETITPEYIPQANPPSQVLDLEQPISRSWAARETVSCRESPAEAHHKGQTTVSRKVSKPVALQPPSLRKPPKRAASPVLATHSKFCVLQVVSLRSQFAHQPIPHAMNELSPRQQRI